MLNQMSQAYLQFQDIQFITSNTSTHVNSFFYSIQALAEAKKRIEELEKKVLENVPIDTAKEISAYQEKLVSCCGVY